MSCEARARSGSPTGWGPRAAATMNSSVASTYVTAIGTTMASARARSIGRRFCRMRTTRLPENSRSPGTAKKSRPALGAGAGGAKARMAAMMGSIGTAQYGARRLAGQRERPGKG